MLITENGLCKRLVQFIPTLFLYLGFGIDEKIFAVRSFRCRTEEVQYYL